MPGGGTPLTTSITSIAIDHGDIFAVGPQNGTPYTSVYEVNKSGQILSTGTLFYPVPGGGAPLTTSITSIAMDGGDIFAVGPQNGTPYTNLYKMNESGQVLSSGTFFYPVPGGGAPLTTPIAGIAIDGGDIFAVGPQGGTPYTSVYEMNESGQILSTGTLFYPAPGGATPLTTSITSIAIDGGDIFAVGPQGGTPYTSVYEMSESGQILSTGTLFYPVPGGGAPLTTPIAGIAIDGGGGVPEPAAWALMLAGFASLGAALRARRAARGSVTGEGHARA